MNIVIQLDLEVVVSCGENIVSSEEHLMKMEQKEFNSENLGNCRIFMHYYAVVWIKNQCGRYETCLVSKQVILGFFADFSHGREMQAWTQMHYPSFSLPFGMIPHDEYTPDLFDLSRFFMLTSCQSHNPSFLPTTINHIP